MANRIIYLEQCSDHSIGIQYIGKLPSLLTRELYCLSVCVCLCVYLCRSVCLNVFICAFLSVLCLSVCLSVWVCMPVLIKSDSSFILSKNKNFLPDNIPEIHSCSVDDMQFMWSDEGRRQPRRRKRRGGRSRIRDHRFSVGLSVSVSFFVCLLPVLVTLYVDSAHFLRESSVDRRILHQTWEEKQMSLNDWQKLSGREKQKQKILTTHHQTSIS